MKNKMHFVDFTILLGYIFSVLGGVIGIVLGALLFRNDQPGVQKHAKMIFGASIATTLLYICFTLLRLKLLGSDIIVFILLSYFIVSAVLGGLIAQKKEDYFTRGFFLALFTGAWGLVVLFFAPWSRAKANMPSDKHYWPRESWISLLLLSMNIMTLLFAGKLIR